MGMINPWFHGSGNTCELTTLLNKCTRASWMTGKPVLMASFETSSKYVALPSFKDFITFRNSTPVTGPFSVVASSAWDSSSSSASATYSANWGSVLPGIAVFSKRLKWLNQLGYVIIDGPSSGELSNSFIFLQKHLGSACSRPAIIWSFDSRHFFFYTVHQFIVKASFLYVTNSPVRIVRVLCESVLILFKRAFCYV